MSASRITRVQLWPVRCLFLGSNVVLGCFVRYFFRKASDPNAAGTIVMYRTARLGDFINTIPAFHVLRRRFPTARLVLITATSTIPRLQKITAAYSGTNSLPWLEFVSPGVVDEVRVLDFGDRRQALKRMRQWMRDYSPDMFFILPFSGEGFLSRLKKLMFVRMAGFKGKLHGWRVRSTMGALRHVQYRAGLYEHQVWGPLRALEECAAVPRLTDRDVDCSLFIEPMAQASVARLLEQRGFSGRRRVAIFPGGTFPHKRWPPESFQRLCLRLHERTDCAFVILGSQMDSSLCAALASALGSAPVLNLAAQTSLMELAALVRQCELFVGNDSGPAHVASAAGCRCVTIMSGIEYPGVWEPWGNHKLAVRVRVPCAPCHSSFECPLGTRACVENIGVDQVFDVCCRLLA